MNEDEVKKVVRKRYAEVAKNSCSCCMSESSCCSAPTDEQVSKVIGYSEEEINNVPEGANLGLGCGNPTGLASLKEGDQVLDLGSGAGFDCFLAAKKVGKTGNVIGVDMTPEMLEKARFNAVKGKYRNVEFRLGEIENLPVADNSVDVVISNCVINLAPNKKRVFEEAFRVLAPKGRLMVSDIVLLKKLPVAVQESAKAYSACIAGAEIKDKYLDLLSKAGFKEVSVLQEKTYPLDLIISEPESNEVINRLGMTQTEVKDVANSIVSISVSALKP
jgi:ubiquinone/menaquinone biosynthesis C-methylase UbiE